MGLAMLTGLTPDTTEPVPVGVATEFLDDPFFILIEEYGLVPLEKDILAYKRTPISLWPASIATESAESPSLSVALMLISGWCISSFTISIWPCSAAHIRAVLPSSSLIFTSAPASVSSCTMSSRPWLTASIRAVCPCWAA